MSEWFECGVESEWAGGSCAVWVVSGPGGWRVSRRADREAVAIQGRNPVRPKPSPKRGRAANGFKRRYFADIGRFLWANESYRRYFVPEAPFPLRLPQITPPGFVRGFKTGFWSQIAIPESVRVRTLEE